MRNNLLNLVFGILALVLGGAAEELCPKFAGVGIPALMAAVIFTAQRRPLLPAVMFAIAAGAVEDALSGLPAMTSAAFMVALAAFANRASIPAVAVALAYPLYQAWIAVWVPSLAGSIWLRLLLAAPFGVATAYAVFYILNFTVRKAALDDEG